MKICQFICLSVLACALQPLPAQNLKNWTAKTALDNRVLHAIESAEGSLLAAGLEASMHEAKQAAAVWRFDADGKVLEKATFGARRWQVAQKIVELPDGKILVAGNASDQKMAVERQQVGGSLTGWVKIFSKNLDMEKTSNFTVGQQVLDVVADESRQAVQVLTHERRDIFLKNLDKNCRETSSIALSEKIKLKNVQSAGLLRHDGTTYVFGAVRREVDDKFAQIFVLTVGDDGTVTRSVFFQKIEIQSVSGMVGIGKRLFLTGTAEQIRSRQNPFLLSIGTDLNEKANEFFFEEFEERDDDRTRGIVVLNDNLLAIFGSSRSHRLGSKTDDGFVIWTDASGKQQSSRPFFWGEKLDDSFETAFIRGDSALWLMGFQDRGNLFGGNFDCLALRLDNEFSKKIDPARIPKTRYVPPRPAEPTTTVDPTPPVVDVKPSAHRPKIDYLGLEIKPGDTVAYRRAFDLRALVISVDLLRLSDFHLIFNGQDIVLDESAAAKLNARLVKIDAQRQELQLTLNLQPKMNTIQVWTAATGERKETTTARLQYSPHDLGTLYVLSIGVPDETGRLKYTQKDAEDFAKIFASQQGKLYGNVEIKVLTSQEQTMQQNMTTEINRFTTLQKRNALSEKDAVVLFISTHGLVDDKGGFRLKSSKYDPENKKYTTLSFGADILDVLEPLSCHKFVFIDACHSGSVNEDLLGRKDVAEDFSGAFAKLITASKSVRVMASCGPLEFSYEHEDWDNGAFTKVLIELLGQKDSCKRLDTNTDLAVSLSELYPILQKNVQELVAKKRKNASQTPFIPQKLLAEDVPFFAY